ncbi:MAG: transposase family protein [Bacteroidales bacterium]|nr:transposase family protein [Bacteroidales bacterium]
MDQEKGELNIEIDFPKGSEFEYKDKETGEIKRYKAYDTSIKVWRHMNFFQYRCYLHARVPSVKIENGIVKQAITSGWPSVVLVAFCFATLRKNTPKTTAASLFSIAITKKQKNQYNA